MTDKQKNLTILIASILVVVTIIATAVSYLLFAKTQDLPKAAPFTPAKNSTDSNPDQTTSDVLSSDKFKAEVKINPSVAPER